MIKVDVSLKSLEGWEDQLDRVLDAVSENLEDVANLVRDEAKRSSEFADKTGKLRRSIKKRKSRFDEGGFIVETKAPHSHLVEFGHVLIAWGHSTGKRVPPHSYMRPAVKKGFEEAINKFRGNK